jgi:hypothetical protein
MAKVSEQVIARAGIECHAETIHVEHFWQMG